MKINIASVGDSEGHGQAERLTGTIQEEEVDFLEYKGCGDNMRGRGRFLDDINNRADPLVAGAIDPGRVRGPVERGSLRAPHECILQTPRHFCIRIQGALRSYFTPPSLRGRMR